MGPTGTPTETPGGETVVLVGRRPRQRGAVLDRAGAARAPASACSTSPATRSMIDRYKVAEIEAAADVVVWCCDEAPGFTPDAPAGQDVRRQHRAGDARVRERRARRAADSAARRRPHHRHRLGPHDGGGRARAPRRAAAVPASRSIVAIGSINSPMQCMMKEICAQCLQPHVDPADRQGATSSRASTRTSRSTASISPRSTRG